MAVYPDVQYPEAPPSEPGALIDLPWVDENGVWHIGGRPGSGGGGLGLPGPIQGPVDPNAPLPSTNPADHFPPTTGPTVPSTTPAGSVTPPGNVYNNYPSPPQGFNVGNVGGILAGIIPLLAGMGGRGNGNSLSELLAQNPQLANLLKLSEARSVRTDPLHAAITQLSMQRLPTNVQMPVPGWTSSQPGIVETPPPDLSGRTREPWQQ